MTELHPLPPLRFGTEGWRAVIGDEMTFQNVERVAQAIAHVMRSRGTAGSPAAMGVGYDTRFLSEHFARRVAEVLTGNGIRVHLAGRPGPTCAVSRLVVDRALAAGVMITASHNPPIFNGIKVKGAFGGSIDPEQVKAIESAMDREPVVRRTLSDATDAGLLQMLDPLPPYLQGIRRSVDMKRLKRAGLRILVDSMHGTGDHLIAALLKGTTCRVVTLRGAPDPLFGGSPPEPIAKYLGTMRQLIRRGRYHVGIANDGDADRIGAMQPNGQFVTPGQILVLLLVHLLDERGLTGGVVKTVSNTSLIDAVAAERGLRCYEVPVGFKHVAALMQEEDILIGGEESGGIGLKGYLPERDGILLGCLLLEVLATHRTGIDTLLKRLDRRYGRFVYGRQDLTYPDALKPTLVKRLTDQRPDRMFGTRIAQVNPLDGVKFIGQDGSWSLFRLSGTEPILRIYAEARTQRQVDGLLAWGKRLAFQR